MLSDEGKKAIEYLKIEYEKLMKEDNILFPLYKSDAKRLIDIIEKQSKEIEELKRVDISNSQIIANMSTRHFNDREKIRKYESLVDKIKAEIEELDDNDIGNFERRCKQEVLQSLLEKE